MRDPDLVTRAQRAAVALERAWERWRAMHGLSAEPMPPVSSYVGYSIEEPWGRPRVVLVLRLRRHGRGSRHRRRQPRRGQAGAGARMHRPGRPTGTPGATVTSFGPATAGPGTGRPAGRTARTAVRRICPARTRRGATPGGPTSAVDGAQNRAGPAGGTGVPPAASGRRDHGSHNPRRPARRTPRRTPRSARRTSLTRRSRPGSPVRTTRQAPHGTARARPPVTVAVTRAGPRPRTKAIRRGSRAGQPQVLGWI